MNGALLFCLPFFPFLDLSLYLLSVEVIITLLYYRIAEFVFALNVVCLFATLSCLIRVFKSGFILVISLESGRGVEWQ